MEKNYYEILEINKNASKEIIDKAYRVLAKKYHPDLQEGDAKKECEEKLKEINEAYETLSDPEKRSEYDQTLQSSTISQEEYENLYRQKEYMKQKMQEMQQDQTANQQYQSNMQNNNVNSNMYGTNPLQNEQDYLRAQQQARQQYQQEMNDALNKAYHDAYIQDLKRRGYKIRYKKTMKDYISIFLTFAVIILAFVILWQIPFIRNQLIELYRTNEVVHFIVDLFISFFKAILPKK